MIEYLLIAYSFVRENPLVDLAILIGIYVVYKEVTKYRSSKHE